MRVEEPASLAAIVDASLRRGATVLWLEPRGFGECGHRGSAANRETPEVVALVGPEGGWSEREWTVLEKAATEGAIKRVRLTTTVLRIETACAAIGAIVMTA